ncbi:MAG: methyl-accepting chemotaxis protein [Nitrospinae bacterium]|nr:methyl-accepting chemotaxis protein [Nitrospinota bacterium]
MRSWLLRLSVRPKILGGFLMVLLLLMGSALYSFHNGGQILRYSTRLKEKTYPALEKTGLLIDLLRQTKEAFMAAVAESDRDRLTRAEKAAVGFSVEIGQLSALIGEKEPDLQEIQQLYDDYFRRGKGVIDQVLAGKELATLAEELNWVNATAGTLNEKLKRYHDKKHAELTGSVASIQDFTRKSRSLTLLFALVPLLPSVLISILISRRIITPLKRAKGLLQEIAQGDFSQQMEGRYEGELGELAEAINGMTADINEALRRVAEASQRVTASAEMLSVVARETANGVEGQTQQTEQIAAAIEEMSASIMEVAGNSRQVEESAREAVRKAAQGVESVKATIEGMGRIAEAVRRSAGTITTLGQSSGQIGEIISVIDEIADQTNLLALNAAIEAARAGEHGRGFAVVSDEVRKLSERTTTATKEIAKTIKTIQIDTGEAVASMAVGTQEVEAGVKLATRAGEVLSQIAETVQGVTERVQQVAATTGEQTRVVEQVAAGIETVARVSEQTAAGAQQSLSASQELSSLALALQEMLSGFNLGQDGGRPSSQETLPVRFAPFSSQTSLSLKG